MATTLGLTLMLALTGQRVPIGQLRPAPAFSEDAAIRLAYMKDSVAPYRIRRPAAGSPPSRLRPDPMIEAGPDPAGRLRWEFAWAPMSSFELKAFWKGTQVWTLPWRKLSDDPTGAFHDMPYPVEPR